MSHEVFRMSTAAASARALVPYTRHTPTTRRGFAALYDTAVRIGATRMVTNYSEQFAEWAMEHEDERRDPDADIAAAKQLLSEIYDHGANGVFAILGAAGTGKTELIRHIASTYADRTIFAATTNAAAGVLDERLHRMPEPGRSDLHPLPPHMQVKTAKAAFTKLQFEEPYFGAVAVMVKRVANRDRLGLDEVILAAGLGRKMPVLGTAEGVEALIGKAPAWFTETLNATGDLNEILDAVLDGSIEAAFTALGINTLEAFDHEWKESREAAELVAVIDEASMLMSDDLEKIAGSMRAVILVGDLFQLPPVDDESKFAVPALSTVQWGNQAHLTTVRRTGEDNDIAEWATELLNPKVALADWVREVEANAKNVKVVDSYDATLAASDPILAYTNVTRTDLCRAWRAAMGIGSPRLIPGEPGVVNWVSRRFSDQAEEIGIRKGTRAVFLDDQRHSLSLLINGERVDHIPALALMGKSSDRMTRAAVGEVELWHGAAMTGHKAQGSQWQTIQISLADLNWFARSTFGNEAAADLPGMPVWRRWAYTAITRATQEVRLVRVSQTINKGVFLNRPQNVPRFLDRLTAPAGLGA
jgi:hypothetical protein